MDTLAVGGDEGRVLVSEMLRGADKQALIRGCPNGETLLRESAITHW